MRRPRFFLSGGMADASEPTARMYTSTRNRAGGWKKSIDWDDQGCLFTQYRNPFIGKRHGWLLPHGTMEDQVLGLREPIPFHPSLEAILHAPGLMDERRDNRCCSPLDWGTTGDVAVALRNTLYSVKVDDDDSEPQRLVTVGSGEGPGEGPLTGVAWSPGDERIAIGFRDAGAAVIHLWDTVASTWDGSLVEGVGQHTTMSWNWIEPAVLTYGGSDGSIFSRDMRAPLHSSVVRSFHGGHKGEVCKLRWSDCGDRLASGDEEGVICIWDICMTGRWLHTFDQGSNGPGSSAVKALSWCPIHTHDLAACRGNNISFFNTNHGVHLWKMETEDEILGLAWAQNEKFFLTTHCGIGQQKCLSYWHLLGLDRVSIQSPSCSNVVFTAQSPDSTKLAIGLVDPSTHEERVEIKRVYLEIAKCPQWKIQEQSYHFVAN